MVQAKILWPTSVGLGCVALAVASGAMAAGWHSDSAVGEGAALAAFDRIQDSVVAADGRPDSVSFCLEHASDQTMCAMSLEVVGSAVPVRPAQILGTEPLEDGSVVVQVTGVLTTGEPYRGFVQIIEDGDVLVAVDPVYWADRDFTQDRKARPAPVG
ncbi:MULTISPECIES: hypothetical protein [Microbacterium]|uniref:hypothetical protein n=1 Tax=Microbacterium TaxID=33882 RepID=UPI00146CA957|nr:MULTISPECIES: hypothetical protein [Microbacterium]